MIAAEIIIAAAGTLACGGYCLHLITCDRYWEEKSTAPRRDENPPGQQLLPLGRGLSKVSED
ncbi:MAG: hypothetical protein WCS94_25210 [Verrucomicrobiota bacterium]